MSKTVVSPEIARKFQPWLELDPNRDTSGLAVGEDAVFQSLEEKIDYYHQALFGPRFSTAVFLAPEREFNQMMFVKARVTAGDRVLLIGEALEPMRLVELAHETVGNDVEIVPIEMRPLAAQHKAGRWGMYRELSADHADGAFDAVVAAQWHHCDDLIPEFESLVRITKPGGKLVLVDNGPSIATFELAKQDVLLNWLLRIFVTWAGSRHVSTEEAFDYQKSHWLARRLDEIVDAATEVLQDTHVWEYKGMSIVDGTCPS